MSLKNYVLLSKPYATIPPMFVCYSVSKTYVIEKLCLYGILSLNPVFFCLTQKPHPVRRPLSVGEGLGVRLCTTEAREPN